MSPRNRRAGNPDWGALLARLQVALAIVVSVIAISIVSWLLPSEQLTAVSSAVQTIGVVVALGIGAYTLTEERRARRVDRTLDVLQELMSGDVDQARERLHAHLRMEDGLTFRRVGRDDLLQNQGLGSYDKWPDESPFRDYGRLCRFFERADVARRKSLVDIGLFVELIGRHAIWWAEAFANDRELSPPIVAAHAL